MEKKFDKELLYKNAIRSIEDGIIDIKEYGRNEAGIKNLYSGVLLLYKYYICKYDETLIYNEIKWKLEDKKKQLYRPQKTNNQITINYDGIKKVFAVLGKEYYFDRILVKEEFEIVEKIEPLVFHVIMKNINKLFLKSPNELKTHNDNILLKIQELRNIVSKREDNELSEEQIKEEVLKKLEKDFIIQKILLKGIFNMNKNKENPFEKFTIDKYLKKLINIDNNRIDKIFNNLKKRRNSIEHYYWEENDRLDVISDIENYKLIIWDFLLKYLKKDPKKELKKEIIEYFAENEKLRLQLEMKKVTDMIESLSKKYPGNVGDMGFELPLNCPICSGDLTSNYNEGKMKCDKCSKEFTYEEFINEVNKPQVIDIYLSSVDINRFDEDVYISDDELECPRCKQENSFIFFDPFKSIFCTNCKRKFTIEDLLLNKGYNRCLEETASIEYINKYNKGIPCNKICQGETCTEHDVREDWEKKIDSEFEERYD